jgi:phage regulator Rha-like protein
MGLIVKSAINANKPPLVQKVIVINYGEILHAVEKEKKEIIDSIKNEVKELKMQNEQLLAKANVKPKVVVLKETEIKHNTSNQIVVNQRYTPSYHVIQKKSGTLEIIE